MEASGQRLLRHIENENLIPALKNQLTSFQTLCIIFQKVPKDKQCIREGVFGNQLIKPNPIAKNHKQRLLELLKVKGVIVMKMSVMGLKICLYRLV